MNHLRGGGLKGPTEPDTEEEEGTEHSCLWLGVPVGLEQVSASQLLPPGALQTASCCSCSLGEVRTEFSLDRTRLRQPGPTRLWKQPGRREGNSNPAAEGWRLPTGSPLLAPRAGAVHLDCSPGRPCVFPSLSSWTSPRVSATSSSLILSPCALPHPGSRTVLDGLVLFPSFTCVQLSGQSRVWILHEVRES